jgi:probable O-glycosylation ligase (exosortase A-associated)
MSKALLLFTAVVIAAIETVYQLFWAVSLGSGKRSTMKHFLFLVAVVVLGGLGSIYHPVWGIVLYYTFAVLRPQYLWSWSLPVEWRWSLIGAGIAVCGFILHLPRILLRARMNLIAGLMMAYGLLLMLSCITAFDPSMAEKWGIEYAKIIAIALLATVVIDHLWQIRLLGAMVLLVLGYVAYEINYMYLVKGRLDIFHYGFGGLDNNGAALMLAMGVPFAYAWGVAAPKRWQRFVAWGAGVLIIHAVLMSYSRGAMVAGIVGVAWVLFHHRSWKQAVAVLLALCLVLGVLAGPQIRERFMSTANFETDQSANARYESWSAAWQMAWERPLLGHGIRNSNEFSHNYGADIAGRTIHSQYLQVAADTGLPSMLIFVAMLVVAGVYLGRTRAICRRYDPEEGQGPPDPELEQTAALALAGQSSLLIFAVGGVFLSLEVFELPWMLMVLAGVTPAIAQRRVEERLGLPTPRPAPRRPLRWRRRWRSAVRSATVMTQGVLHP